MNRDRKEEQDAYTSLIEQAVLLGKNRELYGVDWADAYQKFLERIASCTGADRVFVFQIVNGDTYERSFEYWKKEEAFPVSERRMVSINRIPEYHQALCEGRTIVIRNMEEVREEDLNVYRRFCMEEIRTVIAFPVLYRERLWGYIRVDNPKMKDIRPFLTICPLLGTYLGGINHNTRMLTALGQHEELLHKNRTELEKERQFLDVLCRDYTSVYIVDLKKNQAAMLKLEKAANATSFISMEKRKSLNYTEAMETYARNFVQPEHLKKFLETLAVEHLEKELLEKERISFRYRSIPNRNGEQYFEVQVVRINEMRFDHRVLLGFHHIDQIVAEEQRKQFELQSALEQTEQSNEVLRAISKIYYEIQRIDLEKDTYEEIYVEQGRDPVAVKRGCASASMRKLCDTFVVPEYRERMSQFFNLQTLPERLRKEETVAAEYLATDGNWHTARFIEKRRGKDGNVTHVLYVTRLISDEKRREKNWIAIAEEANKANVAKTEFISQIAHDIRTPMNAIMGFTQITRQHLDDPAKVAYGLEKIRVAGNFLQELVDEVLDITRIENGRMKIAPEEISISKVLKEFQISMEHIQMGKNLEISYCQHDILQDCVIVDALRLKQIYVNILSNAVKYTPDGGKISVEIFEKPSDQEKKVRLIARIQDTGIGMSEEYMKEMYSKFTRATDTRINKVQGHGLGLSIVKELVELMDGEIQVQSELGEGTIFEIHIELPYADDRNTVQTRVQKEDYSRYCKGMHLLVAEDNELNYEVISELLEMYEISCDRAADGSICVEMFRESAKETYDAILMDMQMPVMDGIQATAAIRTLKHPNAHQIPIIAMTANAFKEDVEKCMDAGMNLHMAKPVDIDRLLEVLYTLKRTGKK